MSYLSLARFIIALLFLGAAAVMDLKTRRVPDTLWKFMGTIASVILTVDLYMKEVGWRYYLIFIPIGFLFAEALVERPEIVSEGKLNFFVVGWFMLPIITVGYMLFSIENSMLLWSMMSILVMMILAFILYYLAILYGGADAKAVVTLAVLFPFYPNIQGMTNWAGSETLLEFMEVYFPFTFVILLNASIIMLALPVFYLFLNIKNGDIGFPQMLFGYRKKVEDIPDSFVWPMEYYRNGEKQFKLFPRGIGEEEVESLIDKEQRVAWVSPKIPFIVPMLVGMILSYIIGNPLLHLGELL